MAVSPNDKSAIELTRMAKQLPGRNRCRIDSTRRLSHRIRRCRDSAAWSILRRQLFCGTAEHRTRCTLRIGTSWKRYSESHSITISLVGDCARCRKVARGRDFHDGGLRWRESFLHPLVNYTAKRSHSCKKLKLKGHLMAFVAISI